MVHSHFNFYLGQNISYISLVSSTPGCTNQSFDTSSNLPFHRSESQGTEVNEVNDAYLFVYRLIKSFHLFLFGMKHRMYTGKNIWLRMNAFVNTIHAIFYTG